MISCIIDVTWLSALNTLLQRTRDHLNRVLGVSPQGADSRVDASGLPYALRDRFELHRSDDFGTPIVLALARSRANSAKVDVRVAIDRLRSILGLPVVYVVDGIASYERRNLITQRIPFVVPGNQIYLPDLGIDLREVFRRSTDDGVDSLKPATQVLLIAALLRSTWQREWRPLETAARFGYSAMTISRATREIVATGLAESARERRTVVLHFHQDARETWTRALPLMRSPIAETILVHRPDVVPDGLRIAGLTALAMRTMLQAPEVPTFAVERTALPGSQARRLGLPFPEAGVESWQLWTYPPSLIVEGDTVDPLSLILTLRESADERVQAAVDELDRQLPW